MSAKISIESQDNGDIVVETSVSGDYVNFIIPLDTAENVIMADLATQITMWLHDEFIVDSNIPGLML